MATIRSNAEQLLRDSYRQVKQSMPFMEWLELESENDPCFWMWLFDDENLESPTSLTEEHEELYKKFIEILECNL
ncbi:hypothetical protein [Bacteroides pyogenes]|nr:hypothetical protein [Bacteroides pyogenes]